MSDVIALEQEHGDSDIKAKVVWILFVATILLVVTSIVGVVFAYIWRAGIPDGSLFKRHFDGQIKLFWSCVISIAITILSYVVIREIILSDLSMSLTFIFFLRLPIMPIAFYFIILGIVSYFLVKSLVGLIKAFTYRPYY